MFLYLSSLGSSHVLRVLLLHHRTLKQRKITCNKSTHSDASWASKLHEAHQTRIGVMCNWNSSHILLMVLVCDFAIRLAKEVSSSCTVIISSHLPHRLFPARGRPDVRRQNCASRELAFLKASPSFILSHPCATSLYLDHLHLKQAVFPVPPSTVHSRNLSTLYVFWVQGFRFSDAHSFLSYWNALSIWLLWPQRWFLMTLIAIRVPFRT